jgi:hypothetical protein
MPCGPGRGCLERPEPCDQPGIWAGAGAQSPLGNVVELKTWGPGPRLPEFHS